MRIVFKPTASFSDEMLMDKKHGICSDAISHVPSPVLHTPIPISMIIIYVTGENSIQSITAYAGSALPQVHLHH